MTCLLILAPNNHKRREFLRWNFKVVSQIRAVVSSTVVEVFVCLFFQKKRGGNNMDIELLSSEKCSIIICFEYYFLIETSHVVII